MVIDPAGKPLEEQTVLAADAARASDDAAAVSAAPGPAIAARIALVIYVLLIAYGSWFPFTGWRNNGMPTWSFLLAPIPHYWTTFDLITNVLAYVPLGMLTVFALYPAARGILAAVLAAILGALLSASMEAVQTFLPSRVPSNLDLLTNASGTAIGALLGMLATHNFLEQGRLLSLRRLWFSQQASRGLIVLALWPLAQIYPQAYLFGHGEVLPIASAWLTELFTTPIDLGAMLRPTDILSAEHYWLSETVITATGLAGAVLTAMCLFRDRAPKAILAASLVAITLLTKTLASAVIFGPDNALVWLTPGSEGGLLIGAMMLSGLVFAPPPAQRRVAALALITSLVVLNALPANPYFVSTLQTWVQGKFLNFNGAANVLSLAWPFFTLWFLYHPSHRRGRTST